MSKELISKIDNHFTKVENWTGSKKPGSGIILSVNKTIIPTEYKKKVEEFKSENSISDLIKFGFIENVTIEIYRIISEYLAINIKSKSINTSAGISIIFEYITEECGNLELQEINFIFKSGVMGKFGVIYNDISIDTICGKDGWFETYYREYRKLRPEPTKKEDVRMSGKEITEHEFLEKDENYAEFRKVIQDAKEFKVTQEGAKSFFESNNTNFEKELNKIEIEFEKSGLEQYGQDKEVYISYHLSTLIIKIRSNQITLIDIYKRALKNKTNTDDAKKFYLIKELTLNDFKDDCEIYSGKYHRLPENEKQCFTETQFLNNCHCSFIIQNFNKVKE